MSALDPQYEKTLGSSFPSLVAADAAGHTVPNARGNVALFIFNDGAVPTTLTVSSSRPSEIGPLVDWTMVIPAGTLVTTPTFNERRFTALGTGLLTFTLSETTDVQVAAIVRQQIFRD